MTLKDLSLGRAYSSDDDDILDEFYIPALAASVEYRRLAGYFSSSSLAIAARGIKGLISNNGIMKMVVAPYLQQHDLEVIQTTAARPADYIEKKFVDELDDIEQDWVRDHVAALGWLLANNRLEIKVAVISNTNGSVMGIDQINSFGIFHQKVGIMTDIHQDTITFSGSVNETAAGWLANVEEFKVFRDWIETERDYVQADIAKFEKFWCNRSSNVDVIDVPTAVVRRLIQLAPKDFAQIDIGRHYARKGRSRVRLYEHQNEAIRRWLEAGRRGIFEMATGTGKTFAALGCVDALPLVGNKLATIIATPFQHLVQQWRREVERYGLQCDALVTADSSNLTWKADLEKAMLDLSLGYKNRAIVITTHTTLQSPEFIRIMRARKADLTLMLIGDEVHGLGASKRRDGLLAEYDYRLGLSATPRRWFDGFGTSMLFQYFGDVVYSFDLGRAVTKINPDTGQTYLTPFHYKLSFAALSAEEFDEYADLTAKIVRLMNIKSTDESKEEILERLLFERANIVKNAFGKFQVLEQILDSYSEEIRNTIIYCSPQQMDEVMRILVNRGIVTHRFTMEEGTTSSTVYGGRSEREYILDSFSQGKYQVLVAMKCLDEGVDVPPATSAILMASSGNPREYIQRIGRILRRFPGKTEANIYDIVVMPDRKRLTADAANLEYSIAEKEFARYTEIARHSLNNAETLVQINQARG